MIWDEVKELGPLYALGTLDQETAREIEDYLQEATPEQKSEIREWCELVALVPLALPSTSGPDYLRERLLSRIASEPQTMSVGIDETRSLREVEMTSLEADGSSFAEMDELLAQHDISTILTEADMIDYPEVDEALTKSGSDLPVAESEQSGNVYTFKSNQRAASRPSTWLLMAATVLLALSTGYFLWQNRELTKKRDALAIELNGLKGEIEKFGSPTTKVIALTANQLPEAGAKIMWDTNIEQWVISIYGLPAPPTDKEYQLWYVTKKEKVSATTFSTDQHGRTILRLTLPKEVLTGLAATAVTLEPKGGSEQPTSSILLQGGIGI
ncbi:MAG TPA: anti-sigma factor [Blastocatellia bacterium]|nr:anti-sigma factor [Blastocatellia bacterium]